MGAVRRGLNEATRGNRRVSTPGSDLDIRDFPVAVLPAGTILYRVHRDGYDPWWFSHDGSQRFDLPTPWGTCYLAEARMGTFLETLGRIAIIPTADIAVRRLATAAYRGGFRHALRTDYRCYGRSDGR